MKKIEILRTEKVQLAIWVDGNKRNNDSISISMLEPCEWLLFLEINQTDQRMVCAIALP